MHFSNLLSYAAKIRLSDGIKICQNFSLRTLLPFQHIGNITLQATSNPALNFRMPREIYRGKYRVFVGNTQGPWCHKYSLLIEACKRQLSGLYFTTGKRHRLKGFGTEVFRVWKSHRMRLEGSLWLCRVSFSIPTVA